MKKENILVLIILIIVSVLFFTHPSTLYYSVMDSFNLFYDKVYLVLFPFLILGNILINYNIPFYFGKIFGNIFSKLFNISKNSAFLIILSMLTGFPTGSLYINKLHEENIINEEETIKLLSISFFPSPMFVLSTIGSLLLGDEKLGVIILISIYLTNFILGIVIRGKKIKFGAEENSLMNHKSFGVILKDSITSSFTTLLLILGNITIFMILSNIIFYYFKFNSALNAFASGILEMTNGIQKLSELSLSNMLKVILIAFTLSFSGLSIHSQVLSIINKTNIYKKVFINRVFASLLSIIISFTLYNLSTII